MTTLSEIKKEIRPDWYRCPIEKEVLRKLCLKSDKKGFVQVVDIKLYIFDDRWSDLYFLAQQHLVSFFSDVVCTWFCEQFFVGGSTSLTGTWYCISY